MKLDDNFEMTGTVGNISLIQKVPGFKWNKDRTVKTPSTSESVSYYGTPYQALQSYLNKSTAEAESVKDIRKIATRVIKNLDDLEAEIKEKFCIYVKTCKG